jgi:NAD(P)-dependent dehydrogenase (short-subunit alcohol dehydrogenase family)
MGRAIARRLGSGVSVFLADARAEGLAEAAEVLRAEGFDVHEQIVDVSNLDSVRDLAKRAAETAPVQTVVHTAGLSPIQGTVERLLEVDLVGTAHVLDVFGDTIATGGAGVMVASMAGYRVQLDAETEEALKTTPTDQLLKIPALDPSQIPDNDTGYAIAKRANQLRVQGVSAAWGRRGARVNSISPGIISTPMALAELEGPAKELMEGMMAAGGSGRIGTPNDIAEATAFLVGPGSTFITGTDLLVDGGVTAAFDG